LSRADRHRRGGTDPDHLILMNYVAGFMFSADKRHVALIKKSKPDWQKGKLNGIGGKIEDNETASEAMAREFWEETGWDEEAQNWNHFLTMKGTGWSVIFFCIVGDLEQLVTQEEEPIVVIEVSSVTADRTDDMIENLPWLIPLAIDSMADGRPAFSTIQYP
jgi:8-oxo-dGTP diphosphatase